MHASQADYKELFDSIHERDRLPAYPHVLAPWVESHAAERDWLRSFASGSGGEVPPAQVEDLWRLYALGRVNEVCSSAFSGGGRRARTCRAEGFSGRVRVVCRIAWDDGRG